MDNRLRKKGVQRLALLSFVLIVLLIIYYQLGGMKEVVVSKQAETNYRIAGQYLEGKYGDDKLKKAFLDSKKMIEEGEVKGVLSIVYYNDPEQEEGKVKNFIGIQLASVKHELSIPSNWEIREFGNVEVLRARIEAHPAVLPSPQSINNSLFKKAQEGNIKLSEIFIERFLSNRIIEVDRIIEE